MSRRCRAEEEEEELEWQHRRVRLCVGYHFDYNLLFIIPTLNNHHSLSISISNSNLNLQLFHASLSLLGQNPSSISLTYLIFHFIITQIQFNSIILNHFSSILLIRLPVELSSLESMLPFYSAVASARLVSSLSIESLGWGLVPQGAFFSH